MRNGPKGDSSSLTTETEGRERSIWRIATTGTNGTSDYTSDKKPVDSIYWHYPATLCVNLEQLLSCF